MYHSPDSNSEFVIISFVVCQNAGLNHGEWQLNNQSLVQSYWLNNLDENTPFGAHTKLSSAVLIFVVGGDDEYNVGMGQVYLTLVPI